VTVRIVRWEWEGLVWDRVKQASEDKHLCSQGGAVFSSYRHILMVQSHLPSSYLQ